MSSASGDQVGLTKEEISRYSRQIILPELGINGQLKLKQSSVLIVGVGGLGCPAAMFIAAAGIGTIGLIDYDVVEVSNLHRQVIHGERTLNISKAESAKIFLQNLNSNVNIVTFKEPFVSGNALDIVKQFDVVLDCTDNVATRYLLNDACVLSSKPLVSGSALRFEGQLTVYNYNLQEGPCYRCLFPQPPPAEMVTNCSDGGVLGAVPGLIGTMQALETIKHLSGVGTSFVGKMLMFDGLAGRFTTITLRPKQANCVICSPTCTSRQTTLLDDYPAFCGTCSIDDKDKGIVLLDDCDRVTPKEFRHLLASPAPQGSNPGPILIDVREPQEVQICSLPNTTLNIPYSKLSRMRKETVDELHTFLQQKSQQQRQDGNKLPVYVVCRRGNDSQRAVKFIREQWPELPLLLKDIKGGLHGWSREVDNNFPIY